MTTRTCGNRDPGDLFVCTEPENHKGDHAAEDRDGNIVHTWPQVPDSGYHGPTCSHPHNLPYNDECSVWWLRGIPEWFLAHTNLGGDPDYGEHDPPQVPADDAATAPALPAQEPWEPGQCFTCHGRVNHAGVFHAAGAA